MKDRITWAFIAVFVTAVAVFFRDSIVWAMWQGPQTQKQLVEVITEQKKSQSELKEQTAELQKQTAILQKESEIRYEAIRDLMMERKRER